MAQQQVILPEIESIDSLLINAQDLSSLPDLVKLLKNQIDRVSQNTQGLQGFYIVLQKLLDRFFGETTTGADGEIYGSNVYNNWKKEIDPAGWIGWVTPPSSEQVRFRDNSPQKDFKDLLELFQPLSLQVVQPRSGSNGSATPPIRASLYSILKNERGIGWLMKTNIFPKKVVYYFNMKLFYSQHNVLLRDMPLQYAFFRTDNHRVLYENFLQVKVLDLKKQRVEMEPLDYFLICLIRYATKQFSKDTNPLKTLQQYGIKGLISSSAYLNLLTMYILHILKTPADEESEFFMRLISDFWFGDDLIIKYDHKASEEDPLTVETLDDTSPVEVLDTTLQAAYILLNHLLSAVDLSFEFENIRKGAPPTVAETRESKRRHGLQSDRHRTERITASDEITPLAPLSNHMCPPAEVCPRVLALIQLTLFDTLRMIFNRVCTIANVQTYFLAIKLWLLYIRPWKAVDIRDALKKGRMEDDSKDRENFSAKWRPYITANFHFYVTLLPMFFYSVSKLDLSLLDPTDLETFTALFCEVIDVFKQNTPFRNYIDSLITKYKGFVNKFKFDTLKRTEYAIILLRRNGIKVDHQQHFFDEISLNDQFDLFSIYRQHRILFPSVLEIPEESFLTYKLNGALDFRNIIQDKSLIGSFPNAGEEIERGPLINTFITAMESQVTNYSLARVTAVLGLDSLLGFKLFESVLSFKLNTCLTKYRELANIEEDLWTMLMTYRPSEVNSTSEYEFGVEQPERDMGTGMLTIDGKKGKEQLKGGLRLKKTSIRFRGDPLDAPVMSNEWPLLTRWLCTASKEINKRLKLPIKQNAPMKLWGQILELKVTTSINGLNDLLGLGKRNYVRFTQAFRFNLRCFANIRVSTTIFFFLTMFTYFYLGLIPYWLFSAIVLFLSLSFWEGSNTWLPAEGSMLLKLFTRL